MKGDVGMSHHEKGGPIHTETTEVIHNPIPLCFNPLLFMNA